MQEEIELHRYKVDSYQLSDDGEISLEKSPVSLVLVTADVAIDLLAPYNLIEHTVSQDESVITFGSKEDCEYFLEILEDLQNAN